MKFDTLVKERANQRVQAKIATFKAAVSNAVKTLIGIELGYEIDFDLTDPTRRKSDFERQTYSRSMLESLMTTNNNERHWPSRLWTEEEDAVSKELLETMDEMQKSVVTASPPRNADEAIQADDEQTERKVSEL